MHRNVYIDAYRTVVEHIGFPVHVILLTLWASALPASAGEPLACDDTRVLQHLKQAYEVTRMSRPSARRVQAVEEVRETGSGAPPAAVNQYTPSKDYYNKSRYCEARMRLDNGATEQAYFRMDGRKDGPDSDFNFDPCFLGHDVSQNTCAEQRPKR